MTSLFPSPTLRPRAGLALAMALFALPAAAGAAPRFSPAAAALIERAATQQVASGKTTGLAIEVIQDGRVVFARSYGKANLEWNTPVSNDTVFRIASNTKSFTAAAILTLVQDGKIQLDDPLAKYLPGFPRANEVTLRQLLTHTSGIATFDEAYGPNAPELGVLHTTSEMIDLIARIHPLYEFEPGTAYKYSNSGYQLLGAVVEKVSGQSLGDFMVARMFRRLGMDHTAMDRPSNIVPQRAAGYMRVEGQPGRFVNAPYVPYTTPGPAGGLRSTLADMGRWYEALFAGEVVDRRLLAEMITPARVKDGRPTSLAKWAPPGAPAPAPAPYEYGFGIRISNLQGHREYWHSGAVDGFTSQLRTYPDDHVTVVLLANTFRALDGVLETVEQAALGLPAPPKAP